MLYFVEFLELTYKELQMIYGKIDKEVVVCKCCRDFIDELEENDLSMNFVRKLVNSIWYLWKFKLLFTNL